MMEIVASFLAGIALQSIVTLAIIFPRIQRLEQWAWGPKGNNGIDSSVKKLSESLTAYLAAAAVARKAQRQKKETTDENPFLMG